MDHCNCQAYSNHNSIRDAVDEAVLDEVAVVEQGEAVDETEAGGQKALLNEDVEPDQRERKTRNHDSCQQRNKVDIVMDLRNTKLIYFTFQFFMDPV